MRNSEKRIRNGANTLWRWRISRVFRLRFPRFCTGQAPGQSLASRRADRMSLRLVNESVKIRCSCARTILVAVTENVYLDNLFVKDKLIPSVTV